MTVHAKLEIDGHGEFDVVRARGDERLSGAYRFDLAIAVAKEADSKSFLGRHARLDLAVGTGVRAFSGHLERVRHGTTLIAKRRILELRLVPGLRKLAHRRASRVFQNESSVGIARRVMRDHGLVIRSELRAEPPHREICIQHEETDLGFLERLFAEDGLAYRFERHEEHADEILVVFDHAGAYVELPGSPILRYRPEEGGGAMTRDESDVGSFVEQARVLPENVRLTAFDLGRPDHPHDMRAGAAQESNVHEHHGPYGEAQVTPQDPHVALEQIRRQAQTFLGRSECVRLAAGFRFELPDHEDPSLSGAFAVTRVEHTIKPLESANESVYRNRFRAVRHDFLFRPARPRRRVRQSLETATVVGPPNEEVFTDALGRVKVRFHWDVDSPAKSGDTSCWIRVAQAWAGPSYGAQFVPRVGMEVVVDFLGGDPDRPLIVGCVPNATHPPPFKLPGGKLVSGFRTRTSPDDGHFGGNELSFDDTRHQELVRMVGHKDIDVNAAHELRMQTGSNHALGVGANYHVAINGVHSTNVAGYSTTHVAAGSFESVGSWHERFDGGCSTKVENGLTLGVHGLYSTSVDGQRHETATGNWACSTESNYSLSVGSGKSPAHCEVQVHGASVHRADKGLTIDAGERLTLICGASRLVMTPDGITVEGPAFSLKAKKVEMTGDGPTLKLTDRAEIASDEMKIRSKTSSLTLDDNAELLGAKVTLGPGGPRPKDKEKKEDKETQAFSIRLCDEFFHPYASKHYELRSNGFVVEGETDGDGVIHERVPKGARLVRIELWTKTHPTGPRKSYECEIDDIPAVETPEGLRQRLAHLGYYRGPLDVEELDDAVMASIRQFQVDHQLPPTGMPDDKTRSAILERHQH